MATQKLASEQTAAVTGVYLTQTSTPATPAASTNKLYFKSDNNLYMLNSSATETQVNGGAGATSWDGGTEALPGWDKTGDSDTGLYSTAANSLGLSTGGSAGLTIDSSQNVAFPNGTVTVGDGTAATSLNIDGAAGTGRNLYFESAGSRRWVIYTNNTAESGSDAGSNLNISRYTDAGAFVDTPLQIERDNGHAQFYKGLGVGAYSGTGYELAVIGQSDKPQLYVKGNSTQTSYLMRMDTSASAMRLALTNDGRLEVVGASNPAVRVSEGASANDFVDLVSTSSTTGYLRLQSNDTATTVFDFDNVGVSGQNAGFRFHRATNTTGTVYTDWYLGDGSGTLVFRLRSDNSSMLWLADQTTDTAPTDDTSLKKLTLQRLGSDPTNAAFIKFSNSPGSPTNDFYLVMEEG